MMKGMVFAERYQLEDFIGQGGMSLVYRAVDIRTGHSVAVKILKSEYNSDKEFLERFQREAQAASLMSHHNIVNLLDVGVDGEYRYLVLEYVRGNTLKDVIRQKGRLSTSTAIQIAVRILSALQHAHDNGIIHRDIKPQNVLIHSDGHVKVADFGIARMTNAFTISKGDTVVGSVHYSSPEQATGSVVEATSDIYSTGVVLYEMLTGRVPFVGDTPVSVAMQHINDAPPPITDYAPETPPAVIAVVMKALSKSPADRYQNAREMADALIKARDGKLEPPPMEQIIASQTPRQEAQRTQQPQRRPADSTSRRPAPQKKKRRSTILLSLLGVAAVLGVLVFGIINVYTRVTRSAVAPYVIGLSTDEAAALTKRAGLIWQQTEVNSDSVPAGMVISQIPEADAAMEKGDCLLVTVSLGPVNATMISVVGLTYEEAAAKLSERGFGTLVIKTISSEQPGKVLAQNPQVGQPFTVGQNVELTISGGSTMVPAVTGNTLNAATVLLRECGLNAAEPSYMEIADEKQIGLVINQTPAAGTLAVLDAPVTLVVAVASKPYHSEVSIHPGSSDKDRIIRVALIENGQEVTKYEATLAAGSSSSILIPLSSSISGELTCCIYIDNVLFEQKSVVLE